MQVRMAKRARIDIFGDNLLKAFALRELREVYLRRRIMLEREFLIMFFANRKKVKEIYTSLLNMDLSKLNFKIQDYIE